MANRLTYFMLSRSIFDSAIWKHSPHVTRLFIYLVGMARHRKDAERYSGFSIERGEHVTSLTEIADNNKYMERGALRTWSKQKVSRMLSTLEKEGYIKLLSDTYGTHVKLINYDTYQTTSTYLTDRSGTEVGQKRTEVETNKKGKNDKNVNNAIYIVEIVDILNEKTNRAFKSTSTSTRTHINARLNEGYTIADFALVIESKSKEWLGGKMAKFLRPETLFGNKFEGYLQEAKNPGKEKPKFEVYQDSEKTDYNKGSKRIEV